MVFVQRTLYFFQILMYLEFSQQIFEQRWSLLQTLILGIKGWTIQRQLYKKWSLFVEDMLEHVQFSLQHSTQSLWYCRISYKIPLLKFYELIIRKEFTGIWILRIMHSLHIQVRINYGKDSAKPYFHKYWTEILTYLLHAAESFLRS